MLLVDIGNSRIKAGYAGRDGIAPLAGLATADARGPTPPWEAAFDGLGRPERIVVANVAEEAVAVALSEWCLQRWQRAAEIVAPAPQAAGMRTRYTDPARLGVDRWLAALAAFHLAGGAAVAVDCGTALTVDVVSAAGEHLGGVIAPGLGLMTTTLTRSTARLNLETLDHASAFPTATSSAIATGCIESAIGLLVRMQQRTEATGLGEAQWFITGGEAQAIAGYAPMTLAYTPDLVLLGLRILAENEA